MTNDTNTKRNHSRRQRVVRFVVGLFAWVSAILIYYIGFSFLFDTPYEHQLRQDNNKLRQEYNSMAERYDSLEMILDNITARDKSVFRILFESNPYDLDTEQ
ncbi:MAG: M23 family peptidase, partial [Alistipes sp.]|nr:M23 family peptidase [Alistipes sp.]